MVVLRWLVILLFSVVTDFANPALPGALEFFEEAEETVHRAGKRRMARVPATDDRSAQPELSDHAVRAAASRFVVSRWRFASTPQQPRKVPAPSRADSTPEAH